MLSLSLTGSFVCVSASYDMLASRTNLVRAPIIFPMMAAGVDAFYHPRKQIILAGSPQSQDVKYASSVL